MQPRRARQPKGARPPDMHLKQAYVQRGPVPPPLNDYGTAPAPYAQAAPDSFAGYDPMYDNPGYPQAAMPAVAPRPAPRAAAPSPMYSAQYTHNGDYGQPGHALRF